MAPRTPSPPPIPSSRKSSAGSFADWGFEDEAEQQELERELDALGARSGSEARGRSPQSQVHIRRIQLVLACFLSVGSHFGSYVLGPVKTSMHQSEGSFAALISSFQLVNTITPLVSGALIPRFGAARVGLAATGSVLLGLTVVVWAQQDGAEQDGAVGGMVAGLLVFGCGLAPLAVVQESIILSKNGSKSKTVARSIAFGLLLGKLSAAVASLVSEPLAEISPRLPFITASLLALFSFACCGAYAWLDRIAPESEEQEEKHHAVALGESQEYGDRFWIYILVCTFSACWYTTIHLSSAMLQGEYGVSEARAAGPASLILFSSTIIYPLLGWAVDSRPSILRSFYLALPVCTGLTYFILLYLASIVPYWLSTVPAALGIGAGPLCLVIVVPRIVERHQASTALGLHKSAEMAGSVLLQSFCAWLLAGGDSAQIRYASVLKLLLFLTFLHLAVITGWWRLIVARAAEEEEGELEYGLLPARERAEEDEEDLARRRAVSKGSRTPAESRRGWLALRATGSLVALAWISFMFNLIR